MNIIRGWRLRADVHVASGTLAVILQAGERLTDSPIETNCHALVEANW
jgi:hypothetical protein